MFNFLKKSLEQITNNQGAQSSRFKTKSAFEENRLTQCSQNYSSTHLLMNPSINLTILTINGEPFQVTFGRTATGLDLKNHIYDHICQSLEVKQMSLVHDLNEIQNIQSIFEVFKNKNQPFLIRQVKTHITNISKISTEMETQDPYSYEKGVAKMSCGHVIGTQSMTHKVRVLINIKKYQIRCEQQDQTTGNQCNALWDFKDCKKIGIFTKEEIQQFQEGLSRNWIKKNCKTCPQCSHQICKLFLKSNRVVCPSCYYGDFCYICSKEWVGGQFNCGNEECKFLASTVENSPWDRQFVLQDPQDHHTEKSYTTPRYRACPQCLSVIQHAEFCKHMICRQCQTNFCWVCLSLQRQDGGWPCGAYDQFCGKIAQTQSLTGQ